MPLAASPVGLTARIRMPSFHREATSNTSYWIDVDPPIVLRIGQTNAALDALLSTHKVTEWAFITGFNPSSETRPLEQNLALNVKLSQRIDTAGYAMLDGHDHSDCNGWPDEKSFLVLGITCEAAREIGREFGQVGIVCGRRGEAPELVYC